MSGVVLAVRFPCCRCPWQQHLWGRLCGLCSFCSPSLRSSHCLASGHPKAYSPPSASLPHVCVASAAAHHSQPLPFPWPRCWLFSWFSSIHKSPLTATFGVSLPPYSEMLGFDDYGVVLLPCLINPLASSFPVCFCSCSFLLPLWLWQISPTEREPPCLLFFFVSPMLMAAPPSDHQGSAQAPGGSHSFNRSHSVSLSTLLPDLESSLHLPPSHSHSPRHPPSVAFQS